LTQEAIDRITIKRLISDVAGCSTQLAELIAKANRDAKTPLWNETRRQTLCTLMSLREDVLQRPQEYIGRNGEPDILLWLGKHDSSMRYSEEEVTALSG